MVSIGTIFTLIVVGASAIGGYALYRNADKFTGALSRGIETNITNPLGNYFDNLWTNLAASSVNAVNNSVAQTQESWNQTTQQIIDAWNKGLTPPAYGSAPPPVPDTTNDPSIPPSFTNPPASNLPNPKEPGQTYQPTGNTPGSETGSFKDWYQSGYYYINYEGSKYDTQWKLTAEKAWEVARAASAPGDAFLGIKYLGQDKLGSAGFEAFGQSKNYL